MTLRQLTLSNVKGLRRKYAAFLFSSTLAVVVFYLLAAFVMHPDVVTGYVAQAVRVRRGLSVSQYIIVTFTFFFVLYSSSAFVRSRKKEFGLLSLLGATKGQLTWMIITEHTAIGFASMAAGLGLGIPLSRLMLSAMSRILQVSSPIRFMVVVPAVLMTTVIFVSLFAIIGTLTALQISPRRVVRLLREHQRPKILPRFSRPVALLSLLCIGGGYGVAWMVDGNSLVMAMLPVTAIVSLGTYLFFAQVSVGILMGLQKRASLLFRNLNLLTIGDLVFRMKENARVLASVAVLSAAVITTTGTIYTAQATLLMDEERRFPHSVTLTVAGEVDPAELASEIRRTINDNKVRVHEEIVLSGLIVTAGDMEDSLVVPKKIYNDWALSSGAEEVALQSTEAALLVPFVSSDGSDNERFPFTITHDTGNIDVSAMLLRFPRINEIHSVRQTLVVDDALFEKLAANAPDARRIALFSYDFENWRKCVRASEQIRSAIPGERLIEFASRLEAYTARRQVTSLTAMIALFVTVLFFVASGSMLYFRVFSEVEEDREKYRVMRKLGVSKSEIHQVISRQLLVIFFAPIMLAAAHCGFAMKSLSNVLSGMDWPFLGVFRYGLAAVVGFSLVQVVYFLAARRAYTREIVEGAIEGTRA